MLRNRSYATNFVALMGGSLNADSNFMDRAGRLSAAMNAASVYRIDLATSPLMPFTITATAINRQLSDTACPTLSVSSNGSRTPSPDNNRCWDR